MKVQLIAFILMLVACGSPSIKDFVPGTYKNETDGKYSKASNVLVISTYEEGSYTVKYQSDFHRKKDGVLQGPQHQEKTMVFLYDEQKQVLEEPKTGKVITFSPDKGTLLYGASEYRKVK